MKPQRRWDPAVSHRGTHAEAFFRDYFGQDGRRILLIGGAGFDPRSASVAETLTAVAPGRVRGLFLREERPRQDATLQALAEVNTARLKQLIEHYAEARIEIISSDGAVVGGQQAARIVRKYADFSGITDVVLDFSALSKGVSFPIARGLLDGVIVELEGGVPNLHAVVLEESWTDSKIVGEAAERAETVRGFQGLLDHDDMKESARLWLPQLTMGEGTSEVLGRIRERINPHGVCPILPFPAFDPRLPDELLEFHLRDINNVWHVDATDLIYADEKSPLDVYRTILRIADARHHVYHKVGGSMLILSPLGSKALAIGCMMAAYERNFPIVYVESTGYSCDQADIDSSRKTQKGEIIHVWLAGEVYPVTEESA